MASSPSFEAVAFDRRRPAPLPGPPRIVLGAAHLCALAVLVTASASRVDAVIVAIACVFAVPTAVWLTWHSIWSARWRHLAMTDPLTGLPNRRSWASTVSWYTKRARSCTLAVFDLDGFKSVNDDHGHEIGDRVLIGVARALHDGLGDRGRVFRIGGDEFCAIVDGSNDTAAAIADATGAVRRFGASLGVDCSVGVAGLPSDGPDAVAALRVADERMYRSKRSGRFARAIRSAGRTA